MKRLPRALRTHWLASGIALAVVVGGGLVAWWQLGWVVTTPYRTVSYRVPAAPRLTAAAGQVVYRIDPTHSQARYGVDETFIGADASHATGTTNGIAGDIALDAAQPAASHVGEVVVDLEQLHSDNSLRDARIRSAFLDSHDNPLATFATTALTGLPSTIEEGQRYHFVMSGTMTVKGVTAPVSWGVDAEVRDGRLTATATTTVKMSTFGVGPISIVGLLSTRDDVSLTLDLVALDTARYTVPDRIAAPPAATAKTSGSGPSFARQIQPVLEQSCAGCHAPGQVGAAHWTLKTAGDASKVSYSLGLVTTARYMPPWPASTKGVPLAHSRALSQSTIDLINRWASAGGPLDVPASTPITAKPSSGQVKPRPDVTLRMPQAYTGSPSNPNDYRCFLLDPKFTAATYMTGYQFTPDQVPEIHHAQVFQVPASAVASLSAQAGADGKPGWSCYTGPGLVGRGAPSTSGSPPTAGATGSPGTAPAGAAGVVRRRDGGGGGGLIAGWAPGQDPVLFGSSGILFQPGDQLVLQIHYHYDRTPTPDRSTLVLQTAPGSTVRPELRVVNPLAPVEIPCPAGVTGALCDRNAAIAALGRQYGFASSIEDGLLRGCGETAAQVVAQENPAGGIATSSCDSPVRRRGEIVGVLGHMHTLGSSFRMTLDPGTPQEKILLDIPNWNFDWQLNYQLATPVQVGPGDKVRITCTWDRSRDPNRAPRYIMFAEGTEDEMCFATYGFIAERSGS